MSAIVTFEQAAVEEMQNRASFDTLEICASGFVASAGVRGGRPRYVVRELKPVPTSAYQYRTTVGATLSPWYCLELANRARAAGLGVVLAHTHPGDGSLERFSAVDDQGEQLLKSYFERRVAGQFHLTALFTKSGGQCRELGSSELARMQVVGKDVSWLYDTPSIASAPNPRFVRQVLAFGPVVQKTLSSLRVAIVGLGGTGSFVATELAYLGVTDFLLVDPDFVDESNLNRLVGATEGDMGKAKVETIAHWLKSVNGDANCEKLVGDVVDEQIALKLRDSDFIFLCTDSHASRAVINQMAYQYLIPCIDIGVAIHAADGIVNHIVGRTQMLSSGLPCLICAGWIDANQVRIEMMSAEQLQRDSYFQGGGVPQPAVISLNGAISSVAVTTFLSAVAAIPSSARIVHYDAMRGSMRPTVMNPTPNCVVCSATGALARGDTWSLPTRHHVND